MALYWTKEHLYKQVDKLREHLRINNSRFPIDLITLLSNLNGLKIEAVPFQNRALRGMAWFGDKGDDDIILLNSNRLHEEKNFDCAHEIIHLAFHRKEDRAVINCTDVVHEKQNTYLEWQANEGAAQLLIPYQIFIPKYLDISRKNASKPFNGNVAALLGEEFCVSEKVILTRIDSLNYEICQYLKGKKIEEIQLLSRQQLKNLGWKENHIKLYCINCFNIVMPEQQYCTICGKQLKDDSFFGEFKFRNEGAGYVDYPNVIETDEKGRALKCPTCNNTELYKEGTYCHICGTRLINVCSEAHRKNDFIEACDHIEPLPGNARFCPYCGAKTTYFINKYLKTWDGHEYEDDDTEFHFVSDDSL